MLRPDAVILDRVAKAFSDLACPILELKPSPLEPVIGMAQAASRQTFEELVVLAIRGRQHYNSGPCRFKQDPLERRQPGRIEMLDHLDHSRSLKANQLPIAVGQAAVEEGDAAFGGRLVELQATRRHLQDDRRNVDAGDVSELAIFEQ